MERLNTVAVPGMVGRFRPEQIAQQSTWAVVPDESVQAAAMKQIRVVPKNASTETWVNPLDPADGPDTDWRSHDEDTWGTLFPAGRQF